MEWTVVQGCHDNSLTSIAEMQKSEVPQVCVFSPISCCVFWAPGGSAALFLLCGAVHKVQPMKIFQVQYMISIVVFTLFLLFCHVRLCVVVWTLLAEHEPNCTCSRPETPSSQLNTILFAPRLTGSIHKKILHNAHKKTYKNSRFNGIFPTLKK